VGLSLRCFIVIRLRETATSGICSVGDDCIATDGGTANLLEYGAIKQGYSLLLLFGSAWCATYFLHSVPVTW
jgi:hypothetical protein